MKHKRALTLLEIIIAMALLGFLLTALFNCFYQGAKKNIAAKELKQKILYLELFQQRVKNLFAALDGENPLWLEKHPDTIGPALCALYNQKVDMEPDMRGVLEGMLFLNKNKELCLASWGENGQGRIEVLLDNVSSFQCELFDSKKGEWKRVWTKKEENKPLMAKFDLNWNGKAVPFAFFLNDPEEKATYPSSP